MPETAEQIVAAYFRRRGESQATEGATTETSFYGALEVLANAVDSNLNAAVWTGRQKASREDSGR